MWYNGSTKASQALDEGSIPFARTKKQNWSCADYVFWHMTTEANPERVASATKGSGRSASKVKKPRRVSFEENTKEKKL